jgi:putative tryptophan/tyrosine transport system substrate-binding protein
VTTTIPIVFAVANDPVGSGFVASLARPGGNITGLSLQSTDVATKRLELLREILPGTRRLAILVNVGNPGSVLEMGEVGTAARAVGLEVSTVEIRRAEDIVPAFEVLRPHAEALYVGPDALVVANIVRLNILTLAARLPTIFATREFVEMGGLMSYGPSFPDLFPHADLCEEGVRRCR